MVSAPSFSLATSPESARALACARIAPVWPLDESIAVNPWWGLLDEPLPRAAARLAVLGGATPLMQPGSFRARLETLPDWESLVDPILAEAGAMVDAAQARAWLERSPEEVAGPRLRLATDQLDTAGPSRHGTSWRQAVVHQISQFCASRFDQGNAFWKAPAEGSLYAAWRSLVQQERSTHLLGGARELPGLFRQLPAHPDQVFSHFRRQLELRDEDRVDYLHALLLSVNGWASWCAGRQWKAAQTGQTDSSLEELLAIRVAWEVVLCQLARARGVWQAPSHQPPVATMIAQTEALQAPGWIWQRVLEKGYRRSLQGALASRASTPAPTRSAPPELQAYFCIDVRSEVYRRALESLSPTIETGGFAGFFGLPVAYHPIGCGTASARLPGLLAPSLQVTDQTSAADASVGDLGRLRKTRLARADLTRRLTATGTSAFPVVEALGLTYGWKLLQEACGRERPDPNVAGLTAAEAARLEPRLDWHGVEDAEAAKISLAARILRAMSRSRDFAPVVLLVGHGGQSDNNPHHAGLDCGACCGHAGDVNARALADLLNEVGVRAGLAREGIQIPETTRFVAALHNTTTDAVTLFAPDQAHPRLASVRSWLEAASDLARQERSPRLGIKARSPDLLRALRLRANDWSQTRPEWALANNAGFIAAPRARTRGLDLGGRSFLHDYTWQEDEGFKVLELILTAPVVVAHWINFQYYASTVDNVHYGSGNKMLHNVVGGTLGVFEGNGGDLRIGLPMQSLHDGERWQHEPLRLQVIVEAPAEAIEAIVARHETLHRLLHHRWCFLSRLDSATGQLHDWSPEGWTP